MEFEDFLKKEHVDVYLSRGSIRYLVGEKFFVIWDHETTKAEMITYDRVTVSGASNLNASGFIDLRSEQTIDDIQIVIEPQGRVIQIVRQKYEDEFDNFLFQLQAKEFQFKKV